MTPTSRIFHPEFIALIEKSRECSEEATRVEMEINSIVDDYVRPIIFRENGSSLTDDEITLIVGNIRGFWGHLVSAYGQGEQ